MIALDFSAARHPSAAFTAATVAFAVTVSLVPVVRALCIRWQLFDVPGPLKIHAQPVPRLGGAAIFVAISAAALVADPRRALAAWPFFAALALVFSAGFADDLRGVSPLFRLTAQVSAGVLLWTGGWRFVLFGSTVLGALALCAAVPLFANAANLLDGMDAIATGTAGIIGVAYIALPALFMSPFAHTVAWALAASCAGFLVYNRPPAKIFGGDGGSTTLGFLIAFLGADFYRARPAAKSALFFPLLVASIPLLDVLLAALRRLINRGSPFHGDRAHIYDRLSLHGWPIRRIALALYAVTAAFAAIGYYGIRHDSRSFWICAGGGIGLLLWGAIRLGSLRREVQTGSIQSSAGKSMNEEYG